MEIYYEDDDKFLWQCKNLMIWGCFEIISRNIKVNVLILENHEGYLYRFWKLFPGIQLFLSLWFYMFLLVVIHLSSFYFIIYFMEPKKHD